MSRHYLVMSQSIFGVTTTAAETLIKKLEGTDPESAARLRKVNWSKLKRKLMVQAIKDVAKASGAAVAKEYDNSYGGYGTESGKPPQGGEVLGVIKSGSTQLGFAMKKDGSFHTFQNAVSAQSHQTREWEKAVQKRYRELSVEAVLTVLQCNVKKEQRGKDTIFTAKLPTKRRIR